MIKKLCTLLALAFCLNGKAQTFVAIPDSNFVHYLKSIVPSAMHHDSLNTSSTLVTTNTESIDVRSNNIGDLSGIEYFTSLVYLDCSQNSISSLPSLANSIRTLWCSNNLIASLPTLPTSLRYLYCDTNRLPSLPTLPDTLYVLNCGFNELTSLPAFPNTLEDVYCCANYITGLPTLPNSLVYLNCTENSLASMPSLPNNIQVVYLGDNNLTSLPALPHALEYFSCDYNNITTLPPLPSSLQWFICFHNSIINMPALPNLYYLDCSSNSIACFPPFPNSISTLNIEYNSFNCLPNYIPAMGADTVTYPLCETGNTNGCAVAAGIEQIAGSSNKLTVYPNPNNGLFVIEPNNATKQTMQVYDVNGKLVLSQTINSKTSIDASSLNEGVYNISLQSNEGVVNKRVIIVR